MKILWITNIVFPEANALLGKTIVQKGSGGWMFASAEALMQEPDVHLVVVSVSKDVTDLTFLKGKEISYYLLPYGRGNLYYNSEYEDYWKAIKSHVEPDIIHIHGTEFTHGLSYIKACGNKNVVVSIQGLIGEIGRHFCDGLNAYDIFRNISLRDIVRGTCFSDRRKWLKRAKYEDELISGVKYVIGRTTWDKAHVYAINSNIEYFVCNETLRNEFYSGKWAYEKINIHSIFMSQAYYPIKGLHQLLKAFTIILKKYPDATLRVAGSNISDKDCFHISSYGKYIKNIIKRNNLQDHVTFLGDLSALDMKREYLKCNVFICPSSVENSPNSLGEAQLLGTPCIASFRGGIPTIMRGYEDALYPFDDYCMLAMKVSEIFDTIRSTELHDFVRDRHDKFINYRRTLEIYNNILNQ